MSGFTLPLSDGRKHYTVEISRWGRVTSLILLAMNPNEAKYLALPRRGVEEYVTKVRRTRSDELVARGSVPLPEAEIAYRRELEDRLNADPEFVQELHGLVGSVPPNEADE